MSTTFAPYRVTPNPLPNLAPNYVTLDVLFKTLANDLNPSKISRSEMVAEWNNGDDLVRTVTRRMGLFLIPVPSIESSDNRRNKCGESYDLEFNTFLELLDPDLDPSKNKKELLRIAYRVVWLMYQSVIIARRLVTISVQPLVYRYFMDIIAALADKKTLPSATILGSYLRYMDYSETEWQAYSLSTDDRTCFMGLRWLELDDFALLAARWVNEDPRHLCETISVIKAVDLTV